VQTPPGGLSTDKLPAKRATSSPVTEAADTTALEALIDDGKLDEALAGFRSLAKKHPQDKTCRAGIELVEGLKALVIRDRLEAAQRFEAALELDPSNERAARELAEMRRQATNERKGLLSRLMGKKEPLP
jgi:thioredoxin-like negative regulator of GroEL